VPHYSTTPRFRRDLKALPKALRTRFADTARDQFVPEPHARPVERTSGVFEMTFAPGGRATWQYGPELEPGVPHVIWRRVGTTTI
jgi:hypothetical protein